MYLKIFGLYTRLVLPLFLRSCTRCHPQVETLSLNFIVTQLVVSYLILYYKYLLSNSIAYNHKFSIVKKAHESINTKKNKFAEVTILRILLTDRCIVYVFIYYQFPRKTVHNTACTRITLVLRPCFISK